MSCAFNSTICTGDLVLLNASKGASFGGLENCSESCGGYDMVALQQDLLKYSILATSLLSLIASVVCCIVYMSNYRKVHHPEAPIYYVSICYLGISVSNIVSSLVPANGFRCEDVSVDSFNMAVRQHDALKSPLCVFVFTVLYYFTLASWAWGCLATVEWLVYFVRMKKLSERKIIMLHFVGWGFPLPLLIGALVSRSVSGNYSLQTCWISEQGSGVFLLLFVILPSLLLIMISSVILIIGFSMNIHRSRNTSSAEFITTCHDQNLSNCSTQKRSYIYLIFNQQSRLSLFCIVFLVILSILMVCNFYEYTYHSNWELTYLMTKLHQREHLCYPHSETHSGYIITFYIIRFLATNLMGILLLLWILKKDLYRCHKKIVNKTQEQNEVILRKEIKTAVNCNNTLTSDSISSITS